MSEYIDKQAFNDELAKLVPWAIETSEDNAYTQGLNDAHCALLDFPAADVAPVIHARWEEYGLMWRCSRCRVEHMPPLRKRPTVRTVAHAWTPEQKTGYRA